MARTCELRVSLATRRGGQRCIHFVLQYDDGQRRQRRAVKPDGLVVEGNVRRVPRTDHDELRSHSRRSARSGGGRWRAGGCECARRGGYPAAAAVACLRFEVAVRFDAGQPAARRAELVYPAHRLPNVAVVRPAIARRAASEQYRSVRMRAAAAAAGGARTRCGSRENSRATRRGAAAACTPARRTRGGPPRRRARGALRRRRGSWLLAARLASISAVVHSCFFESFTPRNSARADRQHRGGQ